MTTVHRLLDEAFAGTPLTSEVADLKDEIRAGLLDRAGELEASGVAGDEAARRAVAELGDISALIADVSDGGATGSGQRLRGAGPDTRHQGIPAQQSMPGAPWGVRGGQAAWAEAQYLRTLHRVRPNPGFVVGEVVAGLVLAGAATGAALLAVSGEVLLPALLVLVGAVAVGWILGSALAQETASLHPLPRSRAVLWGLAGALGVGGVGTGLMALPAWGPPAAVAWIVVGGLAVVAGVLLFTWLGVTQTNRRKAWAREAAGALHGDDRFQRDPAAAARFGMYTGVTWVSAFVVAAVIGSTAGWRWSWLTFVVAWIVMMLMLARMQFGAKHQTQEGHTPDAS